MMPEKEKMNGNTACVVKLISSKKKITIQASSDAFQESVSCNFIGQGSLLYRNLYFFLKMLCWYFFEILQLKGI